MIGKHSAYIKFPSIALRMTMKGRFVRQWSQLTEGLSDGVLTTVNKSTTVRVYKKRL